MMNRATRTLRIAAVLTAIVAGIAAIGARQRHERTGMADSRKADYIFLEGQRQNQIGNPDAYYELLKRAHELDSTDKYVGMELGYMRMRLARGDSAEMARGYALMEDYVESNPDDFYGCVLFAAVSSQIGRNDRAIDVWGRLHAGQPHRPELTLRLAEAMVAEGSDSSLARAGQLYDSLWASEGPSVRLAQMMVQLHYQQEDTAAMLAEARRLVDAAPGVVDYNIFAGNVEMDLGDTDSALVYFNRAVELDPGSGVAYYSRANYFNAVGDSAAYDADIFRALEQESLDVAPKLQIIRDYTASLYQDSVQQPRIDKMYRRLVELHPHEADVRNLYRDYLVAINDYEGAAEQSSYSLDINPNDERQWLALTSLYMQTGRMEDAVAAAERGRHFFPSNPNLPILEAAGLTQLEQYDSALVMLGVAAMSVPPDDKETLSDIATARGDARYAAGEPDSAFTDYSEALRLNPENMTALNNCAYYLACENRDLEYALALILKVVAARPEESTSLDTYAWVLFMKKDYEKAREAIDNALSHTDEPSAELYEHAGDIYFMDRKPQEAVEFWKKALQLDPDNDTLAKKIRLKNIYTE